MYQSDRCGQNAPSNLPIADLRDGCPETPQRDVEKRGSEARSPSLHSPVLSCPQTQHFHYLPSFCRRTADLAFRSRFAIYLCLWCVFVSILVPDDVRSLLHLDAIATICKLTLVYAANIPRHMPAPAGCAVDSLGFVTQALRSCVRLHFCMIQVQSERFCFADCFCLTLRSFASQRWCPRSTGGFVPQNLCLWMLRCRT